jgi:hypothetical protein
MSARLITDLGKWIRRQQTRDWWIIWTNLCVCNTYNIVQNLDVVCYSRAFSFWKYKRREVLATLLYKKPRKKSGLKMAVWLDLSLYISLYFSAPSRYTHFDSSLQYRQRCVSLLYLRFFSISCSAESLFLSFSIKWQWTTATPIEK